MGEAVGMLNCVGGTPLINLGAVVPDKAAQVWGKLEYLNPGGSLKDRVCSWVLERMSSQGLVRPGDTFVEASAGNTAISLAMVAASHGYHIKIVLPQTVPKERKTLIAAYGAEIVQTPAAGGMKAAVDRAMEILASDRRAHMINQFENPLNPEAHKNSTGPEILSALGKAPDAFVACVGTGGTITGVGEFLKGHKPDVRIVAVEPAESPVLSGGNPGPHGLPGMGAGFIPPVLNTGIIDEVVLVSREQAGQARDALARKTGVYAGLSSGAALQAAIGLAGQFGSDANVVMILADAGERYVCFDHHG
jgi:cysteine synthase A